MNPDQPQATATPRVPAITVSYSGYEPPFDAAPIVRRMLASIPEEYLAGLSQVVLTNASARSRHFRRMATKSRGRKVNTSSARGLYHPAWNGSNAWIEIFMENTLRGFDKGWWLRIPLIRESRVGDVLFHEIGHHIHFTVRPEFREREDVADVWKVRLQQIYWKKRHPWIKRLVSISHWLFGRLVSHYHAKIAARMLAKGSISRAEYEESVNPRSSRVEKSPF